MIAMYQKLYIKVSDIHKQVHLIMLLLNMEWWSDNKSDLWSLGCLTYEMLTLHPPFRAESMGDFIKKVLKDILGKLIQDIRKIFLKWLINNELKE